MNEREIFLAALERQDPEARNAFLSEACGENGELLVAVKALLRSHDEASGFLRDPAVRQLAGRVDGCQSAGVATGESDPTVANPVADAAPLKSQEVVVDDVPLTFLEESLNPISLGRLKHYDVLEVVGRGAFGIVFKAFDEKLQRTVAIKVMLPELAATSPARKRFLREARAAAAIRHDHVVRIYAVEDEPLPYLVMEYVPGRTLQQRLDDEGPLDLPDVLRLGGQIADGLAAAHANDLVHRDVKPGNVLLETGVEERVKLTDFGLARAADDASITQSGVIAGTPLYMAPEQALGKQLDQRADLFSLGSVLYQMVSGRPPFRAPSTLAVLKRVTEDTPRPITEIIPETPEWLCRIVGQLHAKEPEQRLSPASKVASLLGQSLNDLQHGVTPLADAPTSTRGEAMNKVGVTSKAKKSSQLINNRWVQVAAILFALVAIVTIGDATGRTRIVATVVGVFSPPAKLEPPHPSPPWQPTPPAVSLPVLATLDHQPSPYVREQWERHLERAVRSHGEDSKEYAATLRYWGLIQQDVETLERAASIEIRKVGQPAYQTQSILGYLYYLDNDFEVAGNHLRKACAGYERGGAKPPIRPEENPYLWLAQVEYFLGLRTRRADTLRMAGAVHRQARSGFSPQTWLNEATNFRKARRFDLEELCLAASHTLSNAPAKRYLYWSGFLYQQKGWPDLAKEHFESRIQLDPASSWPTVGIARSHDAVGDFEAARSVLESALLRFEARQDSWALPFEYYEHGMLLRALGREDESREQFAKTVELLSAKFETGDNLSYDPGYNRTIFIQASVFQGGEIDSERLVELGNEAMLLVQEESYRPIASLGLALEQAGRQDEAIEHFEKALLQWQTDSGSPYSMSMWIHEHLFDLYKKTNQIERAIKTIPGFVARRDHECYRLHPETSLFRIHAARWLAGFETGRELARQLLSEARQRLQYHPEVLRRLAPEIEQIEARTQATSQ